MAKGQVAPDFIPDEQAHQFGLAPKPADSPDFIPDDQAHQFGLAPESPKEDYARKARVFGEQAANTLAVGYLPQIEGGIRSAFSNKPYVDERDAVIQRLQEGEKQEPITSALGKGGGIVASYLLPLGKVAQAAGLAAKVGRAALQSGLMGFAANPGDTKGVVDPLQLEDRATQGLKSAALGAGISGAASTLGNAAQKISGKLGTTSDELAARGLGLFKGDVKKLAKSDSISNRGASLQNLGKFAKEQGLVRPGDKIEDVAEKTFNLQNETGKKLGELYDTVNTRLRDPVVIENLPKNLQKAVQKTTFYPKEMSKFIEKEVTKKFKGTPGGKQAIAKVQSELENLRDLPDNAPLSTILSFRKQLDDVINYNDMKPVQSAVKEMRNLIQKQIDLRIKILDQGFNTGRLGNLKKLNSVYSQASKAADIVQNRLNAEKANQLFSLTDKMFAAGGLAAQGPAGLGAGLLSKAVRGYTPGVLMKGADLGSKASGLMSQPLQAVGRNAGLIAPRLLLNKENK